MSTILLAAKRNWWLVVLCLSILAVFHYRTQGAEIERALSLEQRQADDFAFALMDSSPRYLCVGKASFDLGENMKLGGLEHSLFLDREAGQKRCSLPYFPTLKDGQALLVATSPDSGSAATFLSFNMEEIEAINYLTTQLELVGWHETSGSKRGRGNSPSLQTRIFERPGAWLLASVSSSDTQKKEAKILVAGGYDPTLMR